MGKQEIQIAGTQIGAPYNKKASLVNNDQKGKKTNGKLTVGHNKRQSMPEIDLASKKKLHQMVFSNGKKSDCEDYKKDIFYNN